MQPCLARPADQPARASAVSHPSRRRLLATALGAAAGLGLAETPAAGADVPTARLGPWAHGRGSFADDTVLMFRGNPAHTFYGTGPVPDRLQVAWKFRTAVINNVVRGVPTTWSGTGWTGTASNLGDYVYFGSTGGQVYCLEAMTGKLVWSHKGQGMFKGSLCLFDNKVYIGNTDDLLRCLDARTGKTVWTLNTGRDLDSSPCVVDGRLYIAGENGYARCLDPQTGREIWKTFMGGIGPGSLPGSNGSETSPAIADGDYYAVTYDGDLFCIDIKDGRVRWKAKTYDDTDASPVVAGNFVFAASEENVSNVYCFEREKGREIWRYGGNRLGYWSTPAVVGNRLYVGGDDRHLHCLDISDGKPVWTFKTDAAVWSSPAVVDGKVIFGSRDANLYMLDAANGHEISRLKLDGRIISSPCVVGGRVWIGTATGWFYALAG